MILLTTLFLSAVAPVAAVAPATVTAPVAAKAASTDKKVCRSMESELGSRLSAKRICKLQSEWRAEEVEAQRGLRNLTDRNLEAPNLDNRSGGGEGITLDPRTPR